MIVKIPGYIYRNHLEDDYHEGRSMLDNFDLQCDKDVAKEDVALGKLRSTTRRRE